MARVITFSRYFPPQHPIGYTPTYFIDKIWEGLIQMGEISLSKCCELSRETGYGNYTMNEIRKIHFTPKFHTIRKGKRFKTGDWFSPRVWNDRPYRSKQITIAPDIQIKKTWDIEIDACDIWAIGLPGTQVKYTDEIQEAAIAKNDGLTEQELYWWFKTSKKPFIGQIICWNENIEY